MTRKLASILVVLALLLVGATVTPTAGAAVRGCGYTRGMYVSVNSVTSCPFGFNVARAFSTGKRTPRVYSPVTGRYYRMYCTRVSSRTNVCRGGNNAYVRLTR